MVRSFLPSFRLILKAYEMELQEEMSVEERRAAVKKAIARMSTQILADPETHIGMLKSLH
ncbi:unnamed protein product, partial [Closterium sp. NIES-53]